MFVKVWVGSISKMTMTSISHRQNVWISRSFHLVVVLVTLSSCGGTEPGAEGSLGANQSAEGIYNMRMVVADSVRAQSTGWEVTWRVPTLENPSTGGGVIGQWLDGLETGLYYSNARWSVYYFGDNSNPERTDNANCPKIWDGFGSICNGPFTNLPPNRLVTFRYEFCPAPIPVPGDWMCLYVDLHDGQGLRFMAQDNIPGYEMYSHVETFPNVPAMDISCAGPATMVRQRRRTTAGTWVDMTGSSTWTLRNDTTQFSYWNQNLAAGTWSVCSTRSTTADCRKATETHTDYRGVTWNSVWYCGNGSAASLYAAANTGTRVGYMDSTWSWFTCYARGATHSGGNNVWYYSQGDRSTAGQSARHAWGYMPAVSVLTHVDPYPGIPLCP